MSDNRYSQDSKQIWIERMGIVALCSAALFVFKDDVCRFVGRMRHSAREEMRENMPIAYEIERARDLSAALVPDLRRNHEVIVREKVEIDELRAEIKQSTEHLKQQRDQLIALRSKLDTSRESNSKLSTTEIRRELQHCFTTLQSDQATVDAKSETLKYREESLAKAQAVQNEMLRKKRELEAQVAQLEARVKLMAKTGVESQVVVDRDNLSRCEGQLHYLKKRLSIAEGISKFSDQEMSGIPANEKDFADNQIETEIDQFLENHKG